jgi:hypothetical protein
VQQTPSYSISSSARRRNPSGIVRPSALAVLRLTTNSNFVGDWTGSSLTLVAAQDAVDIGGGTAINIGEIRGVGHQAAVDDSPPTGVNGGQPVLCRNPVEHLVTVLGEDGHDTPRTGGIPLLWLHPGGRFGSGAAGPAESADRPLHHPLPASRCNAANSGPGRALYQAGACFFKRTDADQDCLWL